MVGVRDRRMLGYDDNMTDPLTLLVLVLALAAGLASAIAVTQNLQPGATGFYRSYLTHILLFNLLILAGLVFRVIQPQPQLGAAAVPLLLMLMAALKLAWLGAFVITTTLIAAYRLPERRLHKTGWSGLFLLTLYVAVTWSAWFGDMPDLLNASLFALEIIVIGGASLAAAVLLRKTRRLPRGKGRRAARIFAVFHLTLLLIVAFTLVVGWARPGQEEFAQPIVNGLFLLLFNLFPPFWIRQFQPPPPRSMSSQFESLGITRREKEIIQLIQAGKTNQEIADELFISIATVKDHNNNLFRKCKVRNRVELTNLFR